MKRIFITGASSGIGLATATLLSGRGDEVWGTSRDLSRIPPLPRLHGVQLDLLDPLSLADHFDAALREAGQFDVVINNAGSGHFGPAEFLSPEEVHVQFQILVFAHIQLCQLALRAMQDRGGRIINVTSLASRLPIPFMGGYNAAKAAMASFNATLQLELAGSNIRIIDLQPADIRTDFNDKIPRDESGDDPRYLAKLRQAWRVADGNMKKAPSPELVAQRIAKLIDQPNPPPRVTVGDMFQATIAPLVFRFLPQRTAVWVLRKYYRI